MIYKINRLPLLFSLTSSCNLSLIGCSMRGSRWSSIPDISPNSRTIHSSPPVSHNPTQLDTPPPCTLPPPPPPHSSSNRQQRHSTRPHPLHTPDTPPRPNTWTASHRTDRPGGSERSSLQRQNRAGDSERSTAEADSVKQNKFKQSHSNFLR